MVEAIWVRILPWLNGKLSERRIVAFTRSNKATILLLVKCYDIKKVKSLLRLRPVRLPCGWVQMVAVQQQQQKCIQIFKPRTSLHNFDLRK